MPIRLLLLFVTFLSVADHALGQQSIKPKVVQRGKKATALVLNQDGEGVGTAFCVDARGYFVTNSHVVNEADSSYSLLLHSSEDDAQQVHATVVRRSRDSDLALL